MKTPVPWLAAGCVVLCALLVGYKTVVLGYALDPRPSDDRWRVQVSVRARGTDEKPRLQLAVPTGAELEQISEQQFRSDGLRLSGVRLRSGARTATFLASAAKPGAPVTVEYRFAMRVPRAAPEPETPATAGADDVASTATLPATDEAIVAKAHELTPTAEDPTSKVRAFYDFVIDEVRDDPQSTEGGAVLPALRTMRGDTLARVRLFVTLARAMGVPARVVSGVALSEGMDKPLVTRAEVLLEGRWVAIDPVRGRFGHGVEPMFALLRGDGGLLVRPEGLEHVDVRVSVAREGSGTEELLARRAAHGESLLDRLSLRTLPPRSQLMFQVLLLVPLGALIVSLFRNVVGLPTFGTFMPILIALALREMRPLVGVTVLAIVLVVGFAARGILRRLRLLVVPRLSLLLTFVIGLLACIALAASAAGIDAMSAALLPMVILTMTIERLGVLIEEEGLRSALRTMGGTVLVAFAGYLAIQSEALQRMVFTFPELNLLVVAALLLVGRYTGYRVSELIRFRALAEEEQVETKAEGA